MSTPPTPVNPIENRAARLHASPQAAGMHANFIIGFTPVAEWQQGGSRVACKAQSCHFLPFPHSLWPRKSISNHPAFPFPPLSYLSPPNPRGFSGCHEPVHRGRRVPLASHAQFHRHSSPTGPQCAECAGGDVSPSPYLTVSRRIPPHSLPPGLPCSVSLIHPRRRTSSGPRAPA